MNANEREYMLTSRRDHGGFFFMKVSISSVRTGNTAYKIVLLMPRWGGQG